MKTQILQKLAVSLVLGFVCLMANGQIQSGMIGFNVMNASYPTLNDGIIMPSIENVTAPVNYLWSNGATTKNIFNLTPGTYSLTYTDAASQSDTLSYQVGVANTNYHFPWVTTSSTLVHTLNIPGGNAVTIKGQGLMAGDRIGVFYDSLGHWACGGVITWNGNPQSMTIYGDTAGLASFDTNEEFRFLIHSQLYDMDFIGEPTFDLTGSYSNDSLFTIGGSSGLISLEADSRILQSVKLSGQVNYFYTNYPIVAPHPTIVFSATVGSLSLLKAPNGQIYYVTYGLCTINAITPGILYTAYMNSADVIQFVCILEDTLLYQLKTNTCYNVHDGFINLSASFGVPPYTYLWNTGASTSLIIDIPAYSNYSVTVTDALLVQQTLSFTSGQGNEYPVMNVNQTNATTTNGGSAEIILGSFWPSVSHYSWSNGSTNNLISNLSAGIYNLTIETPLGCLFDTSITIYYSAFTADLAKTNVSCFGGNDGSAWFDTLAGLPPYSYLWSTGFTGDSLVGLSAGNFTVTIIDSSPDTVILQDYVLAPSPIDIVSTITNNTGTNNGAINITVSGGTSPYSFAWSNGASTEDISNLTDGMYFVTIMDANLCSESDGFFVSPPALSATGIETNVLCNGNCTGAIDLSVSGGSTPYSFSWSNGSTTEDITNLCAGNYEVTIIDNNLVSTSLSIEVFQPDPITINSSIYPALYVYGNNGNIHLSISGGTSSYTYNWSNGSVGINNMDLTPGTYLVTVTDANSCTAFDSFEVDMVYFYANIFHANAPLANDGCIKLNGGEVLTAPISFSWSNGASTKNIFNLSPGIYTVTYTDAIYQSGTLSYEVGVTNNNYPFPWSVTTSNLAHTIHIPGGSAVTIKGQDLMIGDQVGVFYDSLGYWACGGFISWTGNPQSITIYGDAAGLSGFSANEQFRFLIRSQLYGYDFIASTTYDLTGTYLNDSTFTTGGSSGLLSLEADNLILQSALLWQGWNNFYINHTPVNPNAIDLFSTIVASVKIVKSANSFIYWPQYGLNNIGSMQTGMLYQTGMYATDVVQYPCILSNTALYQIKTNTCFNVPDGFIEINASFGTPPYIYIWNTGATSSIISDIPANTNYSVTVTDFLMVQQTLNFTSGMGSGYPILNFGITDATATVGGSIEILTGSTWAYGFNAYWSTGSTNNIIINQPAGIYNLTIENGMGCMFDTSITISPAPFSADLTKANISCYNMNDGSAWLDNLAGVSPYSYLWSTGSTVDSISGLSAGNYTVTITDNTPDTVTLLIDIINPPELEMSHIISDNTGTDNGAVDITVWGGIPPYSFSWSNGAATEDIDSLSNGYYSLTIMDANSCLLTEGYVVSSLPPPAFSVTWIATHVDCYGNCNGAIDLTVSGGYTPYTYSWSNGATTEDLANLCANTYIVTVQDLYFDTQILTLNISQPAQIDITSVITPETMVGALDGAIDLTVSGGTTPYSYIWSNGATTEDIISLIQGSYSINITDANSCAVVDSFVVGLDTVTNLTVTGTITDIPCYGDCTGAIDLTVTGGNTPYNFIWSNSEVSEDVSGLCAGNYMVNVYEPGNLPLGNTWPWSYTITSSNHVILIQSGTISLNGSPPPVGSIVGVFYDDNGVLKCGGYTEYTGSNISIAAWVDDSGTPTKEGFAAGEAFNWQIYSNGTPYLLTAQYSAGFPNLGTYVINGMSSVASLLSSTGGFYSFYFTVNQANEILISSAIASVGVGMANNGAIDLTVVGGTLPYSFAWSTGATTEDIDSLSTGTYYLTLSDANACTQTDSFEVSAQTMPSVVISGQISDIECYGDCTGAIDATVTGGTSPYSYVWSNGETSEDLGGLCAGNYLLNVFEPGTSQLGNPWPWTFANTGANHSILIQAGTVTLDGVPAPAGSTIGVFYDDNGVLECGGYVEWTGATTSMTAWADDSGGTNKNGFSLGESFTWQIYVNGMSYHLTPQYQTGMPNMGNYTTNGISGIQSLQSTAPISTSYSFVVAQPDSLILNTHINNAIAGVPISGSIDLTVTGGTSPFSFFWSNGETSEDIGGLTTGIYSVTVTDANGCTVSSICHLSSLFAPPALSGSGTAENNSCNATCDGSIDLTVSSGGAPLHYSWSNGNTTEDLDNLCAGTYDVTVHSGSPVDTISSVAPWATMLAGSSVLHDILIDSGSVVLNGIPPDIGDCIAVFYADGWDYSTCCGYLYWTGLDDTLKAWQDNPATTLKDGFTAGDTIYWKLWRQNESIIMDLAAGYQTTMPNLGIFAANGLSSIDSLVGWGLTPMATWTSSFQITEPLAIDITSIITDATSSSANDGAIDLTISGGTSPYAILWSNGESTEDIDSLVAGTYFFTITDANLCSFSDSAVIGLFATTPITAIGTTSNLICNGVCIGAIDLTVSGGNTPYSYLWSNGETVEDISALCAGFYFVTITDSFSDTISLVFEILQPDPISINASITNATNSTTNDGAIDITVSGGASPYSYFWGYQQLTEDRTNLLPGVYFVTVTDMNYCTEIENFVVGNASNSMVDLMMYLVSPMNHCELNNSDSVKITVANLGGMDVSNFNVSYNLPNGVSSTELITDTIIGYGLLDYTFYTAFNGAAYQFEPNLFIEVYSTCANDANLSNDTISSLGSSLMANIFPYFTINNDVLGNCLGSISIDSFYADNNFAWMFMGQCHWDEPGLSWVLNRDSLCSGTYTFYWTDGWCWDSFNIEVGNDSLMIQFNAQLPTCNGLMDGSISASLNYPPGGNYSYLWSTGDTINSISGLPAGTYSLTISESGTFLISDSFVLVDPPILSATGVVQNVSGTGMQNGSVDLTVSGGTSPYTFAWSNGATTEDIDSLAPAIYGVTITDGNLCMATGSFSVDSSYFDLAINSILSPANFCDINGITDITVEIANLGTQPSNFYNITFQVGNFTPVVNVALPLMGGDTIVYTLGAFDFSVFNPSDSISLTVFLSGGGSNTSNDTITFSYFKPYPIVSLQSDFMNTCVGSISIDSIVNNSGDTISYYWGNPAYGPALFLDSLCAGSNTFYIDNCMGTDSFVYEIGNDTSLMIQFNAQLPTCNGMSNGSISSTLNYSPGSNYSYLWSTGDTTSTLTGLPGGTYSLTISESSTFLISDSLVLVDPPVIVSSGSVQHVSAGGFQDGAIDLTVSGGVPPYVFAWSNGATSEDITNLSIGAYNVTITDDNGCFAIKNFSVSFVNPPPPLAVTGVLSNVNCNGICDGEIDLTPAGGLTPYSFNWSTGDTTEDVDSLCVGTYTVTVGSSAGIVAPMPWNFDNSYTSSIQFFGGNVLINGADADPGDYIGAFYIDNGAYHCAGYAELIPCGGGSMACGNITMHGDNPATPQKDGFEYTDQINIKLWRQCDGVIVDLDWSMWYGTSSTFFIGQGYASALFQGYYSPPSFSPLQTVLNYEITQPNAISINSIITHVDPLGGNSGAIDLTVSGGTLPYTFSWLPNGASTEDVSGLSIGTHEVEITDANGCTEIYSFVVDFAYPPSPLSVTDIITDALCNGVCDGAIDVSVSGGAVPYSFSWSNGATTEDLTSLCAGNYGLTVYCPSETATYNFVVNEPFALATNAIITEVDPLVMNNGAIDLTPSGGTPPYTFAWSNGSTSEDISNLVYGQYILTLTDANLCTTTGSFMANYSGTYLSFDMYAQDVNCFGGQYGSAWVDNIIGVSPYTFAWSNGGTTDSISNIPAGIYIVTVSGGNGDMVTDSIEVLQPDSLQVSFVVTPADPVLQLNGYIDATVTGGISPYNYQWSNGLQIEDIEAYYGYYYSLTVIDAYSCTATANTFVDFNLLPDWNFELSGTSHSIEIPSTALLQINGSSLEMYDFIGVFYDSAGSLSCGGYVVWQQNSTSVLAYGDNPSTTNPDGFATAEEFEWIVWDASTNTEHAAAASYNSTYPNQQFWQANGQSGLDSLQSVTISGTVSTTTKANLPLGMIVLYQPVLNSYYAVEKGKVINGQFEIGGLLPGNYLVYALPVPGHDYGIPGYYATRNNWQDGNLVHANGYTGGIDIVIDPVLPYNSGAGVISGNIYVGTDASYNPDVFGDEWFPSSTKENEIPARNITVLLFNTQMEPLDFRLSNDQGAFQFEQLELGTYFVKVEKAGLQSEEVEITLSAQNPTWDGMSFSLEAGQIISVREIFGNNDFSIYPNPVTDELFIQLKNKQLQDFDVKLFNVMGQEMEITLLRHDDSGLLKTIDMSKFKAGVFIIEINDKDSKFIHKIIKGN